MAILLLFEKTDSLSYRELRETTNIQEEQFPRHLQSLIDSKLLLCSTDVSTRNICKCLLRTIKHIYISLQTVGESSTVSLNLKYSNKRTKFRIAGTMQKEMPQEVEQTHQAVEEDRKMYLQAAIVRIMKSRKVLKHNLLIQEVGEDFLCSFRKTILNLCDKFLAGPQSIQGSLCSVRPDGRCTFLCREKKGPDFRRFRCCDFRSSAASSP